MSRHFTAEPLQEAACGTPAGANRHRDLDEPVCSSCLRGLARYRRELRAMTGGGESVSLDCDDLDFPNQYEMPRLRPGPDRTWVAGAACGDKPGHWWFPEGDSIPPEAAEALAVCTACPVRVQCLNHALDHHEEGIWGGTTDRDRRAIRRQHRSGAA